MENSTPQQHALEETAPAVSPVSLVARLRELEADLRGRGVVKLDLFGSRARGTCKPDSDVDLLIGLEPGRRFTLIDWAGLERWLTERTGIETHLQTWRSVPASLRDGLASEAKRVF